MSAPVKAWYEFRMLNWGLAGGSNPKRNPPADGDRVGGAFMLGPVDIQWSTGLNIHITAMVIQNVNHELIMKQVTRRSHKMMDSLVHPTFPFMGSYPHSGQVALLFLQRMNPMTAHRTMPFNRAAAVSPAHTAHRLAGNGGRMGLTVLWHRGQ